MAKTLTSPLSLDALISTNNILQLIVFDGFWLSFYDFEFRWESSIVADEMAVDDQAIIPRIPSGVSGTALAASLLRDGWSVSTEYYVFYDY